VSDFDLNRRLGLAKHNEVYGPPSHHAEALQDPSPENAPMLAETVDHLFARIWSRSTLSIRDRRLLTLGVIAALGRQDLAEIQFTGALRNEELTREQIGEVVLHLAYYAGWPNATAVQRGASAAVETFIGT
jgi:4-carboxymuconolactone decarboxylase